MKLRLLPLFFFAAAFGIASASDPDPLQDFCVADLGKGASINGYPCKSPGSITVNDFIFKDLATPGDTNNSYASSVTFGSVKQFPGLNTMGLQVARGDLAVGGLIPPHVHPRASEVVFITKGSVYLGFITTDRKLFAKVLNEGEVILLPRGLIHFALNAGNAPATLLAAYDSQLAGLQVIGSSMFGSGLSNELLKKTFFVDDEKIEHLKTIFSNPIGAYP